MIKSFRLRCFLTHLLISATIAALSLFVIFKIWYPMPFYEALGIGHIILIMLGIDVTLGPLLTLLLAKKGKKGLKFDFLVIGIVQLLALFYGLYSIDKGRPVAVAYDVNRFEVVQKYMIRDNQDFSIIDKLSNAQGISIPFAYVTPAKDEQELKKRMTDDLENGISASTNPKLYQPINAMNIKDILKTSKPVTDLYKFNDKASVDEVLKKYNTADKFVVAVSNEKSMSLLINSKNGQVVGLTTLRPW